MSQRTRTLATLLVGMVACSSLTGCLTTRAAARAAETVEVSQLEVREVTSARLGEEEELRVCFHGVAGDGLEVIEARLRPDRLPPEDWPERAELWSGAGVRLVYVSPRYRFKREDRRTIHPEHSRILRPGCMPPPEPSAWRAVAVVRSPYWGTSQLRWWQDPGAFGAAHGPRPGAAAVLYQVDEHNLILVQGGTDEETEKLAVELHTRVGKRRGALHALLPFTFVFDLATLPVQAVIVFFRQFRDCCGL